MIRLIKVTKVTPIGRYQLAWRFSDGTSGVRDCADIVAEGGTMVAPLADEAYFARVFLEFGVPTWPNGFAIDAIALHVEVSAAGLLSPAAA